MKYNRVILIMMVFAFAGQSAFAQKGDKKKKEKTKTEQMSTTLDMKSETDTASYSLGVLIAKNLVNQGADSLNVDLFMAGFNDVVKKQNLKVTEAQAQQIANAYMGSLSQKKIQRNIEQGKKFLEENKKKEGVQVTASGLQYFVIRQGTGPKPTDLNTSVTAHYHGTLIDGTVFDSSVNRGQPFKTKVGQVIKAWQEALLMMNVGTKLRIVCPPEIAYGERGAGQMIGPNAVLIFEMELISIDN